ncbi:chemotaxis protein CheW [Massilia sp. Se16.2.3]|uniref:chemotaxis protein CheW n=1 Tax=Massilia sp. Se16.2.3 TaxID=2709303 RepID=UPI001E2D4C70|nr:chemotaxis protein CheW [Massilia sp. Se16.2.3]
MNAAVGSSTLAPQAARRSRLRDYQTQLLARMQAAHEGTGTAQHHRRGHWQRAFPRRAGRSGRDRLAAAAGARAADRAPVPGLANVRGSLLGVIDMARYFGMDAGAGPDARLVSLAPRLGFNCALLVSRVYGLRRAAAMTREGTPEAPRLRDADDQVWTPLSLASLVQEERFLHVALKSL